MNTVAGAIGNVASGSTMNAHHNHPIPNVFVPGPADWIVANAESFQAVSNLRCFDRKNARTKSATRPKRVPERNVRLAAVRAASSLNQLCALSLPSAITPSPSHTHDRVSAQSVLGGVRHDDGHIIN